MRYLIIILITLLAPIQVNAQEFMYEKKASWGGGAYTSVVEIGDYYYAYTTANELEVYDKETGEKSLANMANDDASLSGYLYEFKGYLLYVHTRGVYVYEIGEEPTNITRIYQLNDELWWGTVRVSISDKFYLVSAQKTLLALDVDDMGTFSIVKNITLADDFNPNSADIFSDENSVYVLKNEAYLSIFQLTEYDKETLSEQTTYDLETGVDNDTIHMSMYGNGKFVIRSAEQIMLADVSGDAVSTNIASALPSYQTKDTVTHQGYIYTAARNSIEVYKITGDTTVELVQSMSDDTASSARFRVFGDKFVRFYSGQQSYSSIATYDITDGLLSNFTQFAKNNGYIGTAVSMQEDVLVPLSIGVAELDVSDLNNISESSFFDADINRIFPMDTGFVGSGLDLTRATKADDGAWTEQSGIKRSGTYVLAIDDTYAYAVKYGSGAEMLRYDNTSLTMFYESADAVSTSAMDFCANHATLNADKLIVADNCYNKLHFFNSTSEGFSYESAVDVESLGYVYDLLKHDNYVYYVTTEAVNILTFNADNSIATSKQIPLNRANVGDISALIENNVLYLSFSFSDDTEHEFAWYDLSDAMSPALIGSTKSGRSIWDTYLSIHKDIMMLTYAGSGVVDFFQKNYAPSFVTTNATLDEDHSFDLVSIVVDDEGDEFSLEIVTAPEHGEVVDNVYTPEANYFGNDSIEVKVIDTLGSYSIATIQLTVNSVNDAPKFTIVEALVEEDSSIDFSGFAEDIELDELIYSVNVMPENGKIVGTVYSPNPDYFGEDSFEVTVDDQNGGTVVETITVIVSPINDVPMFTQTSLTVAEDGTFDFADFAEDIEDHVIQYEVVSAPSNGTVTGSTYQPASNYHGTDSFTIKAIDELGGETTQIIEVTVTPVNDAPEATRQDISLQEGSSVSGQLVATDVDGDDLTFTVVEGIDAQQGNFSLEADGSYQFTGADGAVFNATIVILVSDGEYETEFILGVRTTAKPDEGSSGGGAVYFMLFLMALVLKRRIQA